MLYNECYICTCHEECKEPCKQEWTETCHKECDQPCLTEEVHAEATSTEADIQPHLCICPVKPREEEHHDHHHDHHHEHHEHQEHHEHHEHHEPQADTVIQIIIHLLKKISIV